MSIFRPQRRSPLDQDLKVSAVVSRVGSNRLKVIRALPIVVRESNHQFSRYVCAAIACGVEE